jgi:hypothetical protein
VFYFSNIYCHLEIYNLLARLAVPVLLVYCLRNTIILTHRSLRLKATVFVLVSVIYEAKNIYVRFYHMLLAENHRSMHVCVPKSTLCMCYNNTFEIGVGVK